MKWLRQLVRWVFKQVVGLVYLKNDKLNLIADNRTALAVAA